MRLRSEEHLLTAAPHLYDGVKHLAAKAIEEVQANT